MGKENRSRHRHARPRLNPHFVYACASSLSNWENAVHHLRTRGDKGALEKTMWLSPPVDRHPLDNAKSVS